MKLSITPYLMAALLGLPSLPSHADEISNLSLTPTQMCKTPPKSPPKKILDRFFPDIEGDTRPDSYGVANRPFETRVDINGDGWCDWVSLGGGAPHMYGESPPMKDFLFLGTQSGWRRFGQMKRPNHKLPPGRIDPSTLVYGFQDPLFVYGPERSATYVIVSETQEDILTPMMSDVYVYRWNDDLDMLESLTLKARAPIILFIRDTACKTRGVLPRESYQTLDAICQGHTHYCDTWGKCRDGKTPLCDEHGNCDEYSVWK